MQKTANGNACPIFHTWLIVGRGTLTKTLLVMKLTIILLFLAIQASAVGFSQTVTIRGNNLSLHKVFHEIKKQTGYAVFGNKELLKQAKPITISIESAPLDEALHQIMRNQPIQYRLIGNNIILSERLTNTAITTTIDSSIEEKNISIRGRVVGENGEPLEGANVMVKGTTNGTKSDRNGDFVIDAPDDAVLVFSYVDHETQEVSVKGKTTLSVTLKVVQNEMNQVVVVGYGTQRKRDVTGSIAKISGTSIKDVPMQSFDQALSGRAAGVNVSIPNGMLGNPPVIRVRGVNSISLSSFPLIVIDGIPAWSGDVGGFAHNNALSDINPADIESFEVLKDAAASAIYGSRAAAGVMLITTKKGKPGKAKVNFDGWTGVAKAMNLIEMLNAEEYTTIKNEALTNAGTPPNGTNRGFATMQDANGKLVDTRWYDYAYRTAKSSNASMNISGATDKTQYFFSVGYTDQQGIFYTNEFERMTGRFSLDHKINERISVGGSFNYTKARNKGLISGTPTEDRPEAVFAASGATRLAMILPPNVGVYKNDGSWNYNGLLGMGQGNNLTPLSFLPNFRMALELNSQISATDRIMSNVHIAIKLLKGMEYRSIFGIDNLIVENQEYRNPYNGEGSRFQGAASNIMDRFQRQNWQNILQYNTSIADDHHLGFLAGVEQQKSTRNRWGADRRIVADSLYRVYQGAFSTIFPFGNRMELNFLQSYFGRLTYDFQNKYYFTFNARRDGYSAFAPGQKFGNFAGGSVGWILSEENFFKNGSISDKLNFLQLKASYGRVGNNLGIGDFAFHNLYSSGLNGTNNTLFFSQAGNSNLTWETSNKLDVGLSFGLLNNRITGEIAYYKNTIDGLILQDPQAPSAGIPGNQILNNVGSMFNRGWEFSINANVIEKDRFSWRTSFNISTQENQVTSLAAGNADIIFNTSTNAPLSIARVGESLGSFYAVRSGGVNPDNGRRIFYYKDGTAVQYDHSATNSSLRWTYLDGSPAPRSPSQNRDGVIMGPALPKWFGGFDNNFRLGNFDLNVLVFFSGGNYMFNGTRSIIRTATTANSDKEVLTRWQKPGDQTNIPRLVFGDNVSNGSNSFIITENIEKGDFLKIRNVALGYTLPTKYAELLKLSRVRFYASGQNLLVFTNYSGFDPETSTNKNSTTGASVDYNSPPMARTIIFGVNVGF